MSDRREQILAARVKAVNTANDYFNFLFDEIAPIYAKMIGQKVFKVDGEWLEKYKNVNPVFAKRWHDVEINVYRCSSRYSLAWTVRACVNTPDGISQYHEATIYIADINGQVLTKLSNKPEPRRTDYTAAEIIEKRAECSRLKALASAAESALHPFGEYDR